MKFFVPEICFQVCRDRLYVFDSGRFSWNLFLNCDTGFAFYFERELYFFLTRKTVFSKKTALSCIFFRISIDNLGPYMCYTIFYLFFMKSDSVIFFFSLSINPRPPKIKYMITLPINQINWQIIMAILFFPISIKTKYPSILA